MAGEPGTVDPEKVKDYAAATGKISSAVSSMVGSDGWLILMALLKREREAIYEKKDYPTIQDFKADREALDIVDRILDTFKGYVEDAKDAAEMLSKLDEQESPTDRGIMLIERAEGAMLEG